MFIKLNLNKTEFLISTVENYMEEDNCLSHKCLIKGKENGKMSHLRLAVKDTVSIAGIPMMNGSHVLEGFTPIEDATIIKRLLNHGITIIGKTNCEDLCFSGSSITCVKGPVINQVMDGCNAGGSSSGSAVAITKNLCDISIAGDQGGSIRIPSAYNGLIGFKPTFGLIPYSGILGIEYTLDHVGPIAKNVKDIALFLDCTAGPDDSDKRYYTYLKYSQFNIDSYLNEFDSDNSNEIIKSKKEKSDFEKTIYYGTSRIKVDFIKAVELCKEVLPNLKVGLLNEGMKTIFTNLKESRSDSFNSLKDELKDKYNLEVEDVSVPEHELGVELTVIYFIEGFFDGIRNNFVGKTKFDKESFELAKMFFNGEKSWKDLSHTNKLFIHIGEYIKEKYGSRFYAKAQEIRKEVLKGFFEAFKKFDLLLLPTVPGLPEKIPNKDISMEEYFFTCLGSITPCTCVYNLTGFPALSINYSRKEKICPIMIVGRHFEDHRVLQFAKLIEDLN